LQKIDIEKTLDFVWGLNQNKEITFSYPNGGYNNDTIKILKNNNCKVAYTTESKVVYNDTDFDFLKFPRISAPEYINKDY
jgi:hypothetical protein